MALQTCVLANLNLDKKDRYSPFDLFNLPTIKKQNEKENINQEDITLSEMFKQGLKDKTLDINKDIVKRLEEKGLL